MDARVAASSITEWMGHVGVAGLVLPDGWFGRPYDNFHQLTWSKPRGNRVILEFDSNLLLVLTDVSNIEPGNERLTVSAAQVVLDWQEYGSLVPHVETFTSSDIALVRVR